MDHGTRVVDIETARERLAELVDAARAGETISIARDGVEVAKIVKANGGSGEVAPKGAKPPRVLGLLAGQFNVPDDFDTMCAEEIRAMFEDGPLFHGER
jgi:prevent-host-death family protein